jgi:hypothetical protein
MGLIRVVTWPGGLSLWESWYGTRGRGLVMDAGLIIFDFLSHHFDLLGIGMPCRLRAARRASRYTSVSSMKVLRDKRSLMIATQNPCAWSKLLTAVAHCALMNLPRVVDGPGVYRTRAGREVKIQSVIERSPEGLYGSYPLYGCLGTHDCGTRDSWHTSGRISSAALTPHDLVEKLSAAN